MKKLKLPKTLGAAADMLYRMRTERLELQKQIDALQKNENELKDHIIDKLPKSNASGISGKVANVKVEKKPIPTVTDWEAFQKYVKRTGAFDLYQRRINEKAITERWEQKKQIPGVGVFQAVKVSCTKL